MAESSAYALRGYSGAAKDTLLASGITSGATSLDAEDLSTWVAADDAGPGRATITDGTNEEEVEFTAVSGNSLTGLTRGVGGTTAQAWSAGATISHRSSVRDFVEANKLVNAILGITGLSAGDLLYLTGATAFARLAKGTARQSLIMNSGATAPSWAASIHSLLAAKGSIVAASAANTPAELAVGSDFQLLRARAGATTGNEWASLLATATVATGQTTTSTSYTDLATAGPAVTLTTGTSALVILTCQMSVSASGEYTYMGFAVSGATTAAAAGTKSMLFRSATADQNLFATTIIPVTLTAGSNTFTAKYLVTAGTGTFTNRSIAVIPF